MTRKFYLMMNMLTMTMCLSSFAMHAPFFANANARVYAELIENLADRYRNRAELDEEKTAELKEIITKARDQLFFEFKQSWDYQSGGYHNLLLDSKKFSPQFFGNLQTLYTETSFAEIEEHIFDKFKEAKLTERLNNIYQFFDPLKKSLAVVENAFVEGEMRTASNSRREQGETCLCGDKVPYYVGEVCSCSPELKQRPKEMLIAVEEQLRALEKQQQRLLHEHENVDGQTVHNHEECAALVNDVNKLRKQRALERVGVAARRVKALYTRLPEFIFCMEQALPGLLDEKNSAYCIEALVPSILAPLDAFIAEYDRIMGEISAFAMSIPSIAADIKFEQNLRDNLQHGGFRIVDKDDCSVM